MITSVFNLIISRLQINRCPHMSRCSPNLFDIRLSESLGHGEGFWQWSDYAQGLWSYNVMSETSDVICMTILIPGTRPGIVAIIWICLSVMMSCHVIWCPPLVSETPWSRSRIVQNILICPGNIFHIYISCYVMKLMPQQWLKASLNRGHGQLRYHGNDVISLSEWCHVMYCYDVMSCHEVM